jgi:hypothetical protein
MGWDFGTFLCHCGQDWFSPMYLGGRAEFESSSLTSF